MRKTALALAAFACSAAAQPVAPPPPAAPAAPAAGRSSTSDAGPQARSGPAERGTVLEEVSGKVAEIDRKAHRLRVETASGPVTLSLDRNTMVYTATGLGTVLDLTPGVQIRAGRNAEFRAYWVQVRNTPPAARAPKEPVLRGTVLEEVAGKVAEIDRKAHRLRIETASGPVTLSLDRNTMIYTATGLGTVLDLAPGVQVRAGRNADFLAYWVQVRAPPSTASPPGQGTGPAAGSAPAGEGGGPGASTAPAPPTTGPGAGPGGPGAVSGAPPPR